MIYKEIVDSLQAPALHCSRTGNNQVRYQKCSMSEQISNIFSTSPFLLIKCRVESWCRSPPLQSSLHDWLMMIKLISESDWETGEPISISGLNKQNIKIFSFKKPRIFFPHGHICHSSLPSAPSVPSWCMNKYNLWITWPTSQHNCPTISFIMDWQTTGPTSNTTCRPDLRSANAGTDF